MSFIEDFKKLNDLTEEQLRQIGEFLNSTVEEDNQKTTQFYDWCAKNNISNEMFNSYHSIILFILKAFIIENGFEEGFKLFENDLLEIRNCDDNATSAWEKLKPVLKNLEAYTLKVKFDVLDNKYPSIEDLNLTCDVRPVLNIERSEIHELLFPIIATIKLSNSDEELIFECNEYALNRINKEIEKTIKKIEIIKKSLKIG